MAKREKERRIRVLGRWGTLIRNALSSQNLQQKVKTLNILRWELVVLKVLARMRGRGGVARDMFADYSKKKDPAAPAESIEVEKKNNVKARIDLARLTRRMLQKANMRKLTACANLRRLARDLLTRESDAEMWKATRWSRLATKYLRLKRN